MYALFSKALTTEEDEEEDPHPDFLRQHRQHTLFHSLSLFPRTFIQVFCLLKTTVVHVLQKPCCPLALISLYRHMRDLCCYASCLICLIHT